MIQEAKRTPTGVRFSSINSLSLSLRLATAETDATAATSAEA